jgi:Ca2+ transporting ATPase
MATYTTNEAAAQEPAQVFKALNVELHQGLSSDEVASRAEKYGPNELPEEEGDSFWDLFKEQFEDPLVKILLGAAVISAVLAVVEEKHGDEALTAYVEPIVILTILLANAFVGVYQEQSAEEAIAALKKYSPSKATVRRDGKEWESVDAVGLVPGDVVKIKTGDKIPADLRVVHIDSTVLKVEQAALTGESQSVGKDTSAVKGAISVAQDKVNICFSGTDVEAGEAEGVVISTGELTDIGAINKGLQKDDDDKEKTPLGK